MSFRAKEGLTFDRRPDGAVAVSIESIGCTIGPIVLEAEEWCSVVASVSAIGDGREAFEAARIVHAGELARPAAISPADELPGSELP